MTKKDKTKIPYFIDMEISKDKLERVPPEMDAASLFMNTCISAIINVSNARKGISMQEQRKLYSIRNSFQNAIAVKETKKVELAYDEFRFLKKCWEEQTPQATVNELLMLAEEKIMEAEANHGKELEDVNSKI